MQLEQGGSHHRREHNVGWVEHLEQRVVHARTSVPEQEHAPNTGQSPEHGKRGVASQFLRYDV